ncbi:MAG: putative peptide maturation dehydrogenase [Tahibacter sp.]
MRIRRRRVCLIQIADHCLPDLTELFSGRLVLDTQTRADLLCPISGKRIALSPRELSVLAALPAQEWTDVIGLCGEGRVTPEEIDALLAKNALVSDAETPGMRNLRDAEARLTRIGWHDLAAVYHAFTRWSGIEGDEGRREHSEEAHRERLVEQVDLHGTPPGHFTTRDDALSRQRLPRAAFDDEFAQLLRARRTTRAYDTQAMLPIALFSQMLYASFGVQGSREFAPGLVALKKTSASGGGLHPLEAYPVVIRVEGLATGLYHYSAADHTLELLEALSETEARDIVSQFTIGQVYFAQAHACVIHVARFDRNYWKYREHAKAYKAVLMDSAHLSQTFYLMAAHLKLGAFYTAAINDGDIGLRLGLDPLVAAAVGLNGVGIADWSANPLHFEAEPYDPHAELASRPPVA